MMTSEEIIEQPVVAEQPKQQVEVFSLAALGDLGELLTAPGGSVEIDRAAREKLAYFSTQTLLVQKGQRLSPIVDTFIARRMQVGETPKITMVDLRIIEDVYKQAKTRITTHSDQMEKAKQIFRRSADLNASDIHIVTSETNQCRIMFRIHGSLVPIDDLVFNYADGVRLIQTICQSMSDQANKTSYSVDSSFEARVEKREYLPERVESLRVSSIGTPDGNSTVLRVLYNTGNQPVSFLELGYEPEQIDLLNTMIRRPIGCNIVAGPTGSGKSTSLLSILMSVIDYTKGAKNIMTVEDPPEYVIKGARQTAVESVSSDSERNAAFVRAIRLAMRHDPDVLMIGEMRDEPSASLAFTGSKTGHQLWTTLHANSALSIPGRLRDLNVHPSDIFDPDVTTGFISQRLVPRLCPHCRIELSEGLGAFAQSEQDRVMIMAGDHYKSIYLTGPGCDHCFNGINGRTVVAEIVVPDEQLFDLLREGKRMDAANYSRHELRNMNMQMHAWKKVINGIADPFVVESIVGQLRPENRLTHA